MIFLIVYFSQVMTSYQENTTKQPSLLSVRWWQLVTQQHRH